MKAGFLKGGSIFDGDSDFLDESFQYHSGLGSTNGFKETKMWKYVEIKDSSQSVDVFHSFLPLLAMSCSRI